MEKSMSDQLEEPTWRQMRFLVWELLKQAPQDTQVELEDRVKWRCAKLGFTYDSESVRKAVDAVMFMARRDPRFRNALEGR